MGVNSALRDVQRRVRQFRDRRSQRVSHISPIYSYVAVGVLLVVTIAAVGYVLVVR